MAKQIMKYEQSQNVIYDNCNADMTIGEEKLSSIIGYAITAMGITLDMKDEDAEKLFQIYCSALDKKIGSSEPYFMSVKMQEKSKDRIAKDMKNLLPYKIEKFDKLIEGAAERAVAVLDVSANSFDTVLYRENKKEFVVSEFSVLKVFRSGANLEIVPCYMCVKGKKSAGRFLFLHSWEETEASMNYKQKKYILTKFDIEGIINRLKQNAQNKW